MSTDSYGIDSAPKEVTAVQKKAAEDKKGSRHADVIDTWDPTGLGSASKWCALQSARPLIRCYSQCGISELSRSGSACRR